MAVVLDIHLIDIDPRIHKAKISVYLNSCTCFWTSDLLARVRKAVQYCRGKNGIKRKEKGLEDYRHAEKRYVDYKLHAYSRKLIDLCLKHQAATLILVGQQEKEAEAKHDHFVLKHWTASGLREKIQHKADRVGITVISE